MTQAVCGDVLMDIALSGDGFDGALNGLSAHGFIGSHSQYGVRACGEYPLGVTMCGPIPAKCIESALRHDDRSVFTAFAEPDM